MIDIQVSVAELHPIEAYAPLLAELGYTHVPSPDDAFAPFFHRPEQWPHTHHSHVVQAGGEEERRTLAFRDHLREPPSAMREYEEPKFRCARRFGEATPADREAYAQAKGEFINRIIDLALSEGYPRDDPRAGSGTTRGHA